jgi:hypothetical protein
MPLPLPFDNFGVSIDHDALPGGTVDYKSKIYGRPSLGVQHLAHLRLCCQCRGTTPVEFHTCFLPVHATWRTTLVKDPKNNQYYLPSMSDMDSTTCGHDAARCLDSDGGCVQAFWDANMMEFIEDAGSSQVCCHIPFIILDPC